MVIVGTEAEPLRALVGHHLGYSDWMPITQEQVDLFAAAIGDHQWIHVDPKRAADGPFGGTVVHGFLILALTSRVLEQVLVPEGVRLKVNYGCERVRFLSPCWSVPESGPVSRCATSGRCEAACRWL